MKRKIFTTTAIVCCFVVCLAAAIADLSGKWTGTLKTPDGNEMPLNYTFKTDSGKLTGTSSSPHGVFDLMNGKLKGDSLAFAIDVGGVLIAHTGKYFSAGDSISLNIDYQGMKMHTTLKRATDK
jgi:hypothetical protein